MYEHGHICTILGGLACYIREREELAKAMEGRVQQKRELEEENSLMPMYEAGFFSTGTNAGWSAVQFPGRYA